jgi:hypothetical protein
MEGTPPSGRAVDTTAFKPDGHWIEAPRLWDDISPERIVGGRQLWDHVMDAIDRLPAGQRAVIVLRDIEGCEADGACTLLGVTAENQRVLLHRARGSVRAAIDSLTAEPRTVVAPVSTQRRGGVDATTVHRLMICRLTMWLHHRPLRMCVHPLHWFMRAMVVS